MRASLQVVLPELQHIRSDALLGQLQTGGGALHQDPGGGDGGGGDGGGEREALQAAPPGSQPGPGSSGDGQGDQTQHGHPGSH